jgi:sugar phosphate isomerase/epimerase
MDSVLGAATDGEAFRRARRIGFAGVEVVVRRSDLRSAPGGRLESLGRACAESGLEITSLVLEEHNRGGIADADPAVAAAAAKHVRDAAAWAAELGADAVLVPFFLRARLQTDGDLERCAAAFRALCPVVAEHGVSLLYEGTLPADRVRWLAGEVGSSAFGCYFDLANPLVWGLDTATEIRDLAELVRRVHVKDTRATAGDCVPGTGRVDFAESARALAEIGYDGWLVLETPAAPPELVGRDLAFTRSVFPSLEPASEWPRFGAFSYDFGAGEWDRLGATFAALGLETVQLGTDLLDECLQKPAAIASIRAGLEDHGVAIAAVAGYRNLIAPDADARRANLEWLRRCLEVAPLLGTSIVATETGTRASSGDWTDSPENWSEEAWSLLYEAIETLLPVAEQAGSILALEATVKNVLKTPGQLLGLLERYPSRHLQVVCDPYNYVSRRLLPAHERLTADLLGRFEHRFVVAHVKDVDPGGAEAGTPEFGTGVFSQRPYLDFLATRRPDLPLIVEHLPLEHVPTAMRRVRETAAPALTPQSPPG